jgi:hypothetical protein
MVGAHTDVMLILHKGLICSVLEYRCIAFDQMAGTHILKLENPISLFTDVFWPNAIDSCSDA